MERCPNCGNRLNSIDVLCPRCGAVVEVIQIKSSITSASETAAEAAEAARNVESKDFSQSFVVYNEDFPTEDTVGEPPKTFLPADDINDAVDEALSKTQVEEAFVPPQQIAAPSDEQAATEAEDIPAKAQDIADDYEYSPRYLEHLKNIQLPEIDDLQSFDPEEFMREYKRSRAEDQRPDDSPLPAFEKRWLEIEEAFETADDVQDESIITKETPVEDSVPERRYRSARSENLPRAEKSKRSKPKKYNIAITVLLWLVVTAAFMCCSIFFDNYVQKAYGSYDSFIYTITDGKIDIVPGN